MRTPVGLRPAAWEPRQRVIALVLGGLLVLALALWWVVGGDDRRAAAACDLYEAQQGALRTVVTEVDEAGERALAAGGTTVIGYVDDIDRELGSLRRWQSTTLRLEAALGEVGDGVDADVQSALEAVTGAAAQMQRLVEGGSPQENLDHAPELAASLGLADDVCATV